MAGRGWTSGRPVRTAPAAERTPVDVKLNRFTGYQSINLVRTDGSVVVPPAPRAAGVAVMTAAVEAIEYRRLMAQVEGR